MFSIIRDKLLSTVSYIFLFFVFSSLFLLSGGYRSFPPFECLWNDLS